MTRRPARKKDTLTSLKRELKVLTINYDRLEVDSYLDGVIPERTVMEDAALAGRMKK